MKVEENKSTAKRRGLMLLGLRSFRKAIGLSAKELSILTGLTQNHISRLENCGQGASGGSVESIASVIGCDVSELLSEPEESRLLDIKANFHERAAADARAKAGERRKVA